MKLQEIHIAIRRADGSVSIMAFLVVGRGSVLPKGAAWVNDGSGWWMRDPTDEVINEEVARACTDGVHGAALGWRLMQPGEAPTERTYRDAWIDDGKAIVHDMAKAKEIHRRHLRKRRAVALAELDGKWMRATGQRKTEQADAIEAARQQWRDAPADPRIEAAQTWQHLASLLKDTQTGTNQ